MMVVASGLRKDCVTSDARGSAVEAVTHSAHTDQEPWLTRLWLDLLAQVCDMGIHSAVGNEGPCLTARGLCQDFAKLCQGCLTRVGQPSKR